MLTAEDIADKTSSKEGKGNFVTEYDKKVQAFLLEKLGAILPDATFICEEEERHNALNDGTVLIIDPIDGTANFMRGYCVSAISVGVLENGAPAAGAIYDPYKDEMYWALKGFGAYCNEKRISASANSLENSITLFGPSPYNPSLARRSFDIAFALFSAGIDIRRSGSAAQDLSHIANGSADIYFELQLQPWDFTAGAAIVTEAGGTVTDIDGRPLCFDRPSSVLALGAGIKYDDIKHLL